MVGHTIRHIMGESIGTISLVNYLEIKGKNKPEVRRKRVEEAKEGLNRAIDFLGGFTDTEDCLFHSEIIKPIANRYTKCFTLQNDFFGKDVLMVAPKNLIGYAVFGEFIENGLKYSTDGKIYLKLSRDGGYATAIVQNTHQNKIDDGTFVKMFSGGTRLEPDKIGTGYGLSYANDIVREHGGKMRGACEPSGKGDYIVKMSFSLPITFYM